MGYAWRECGSISLGILFLIGGSLSDLVIPLFIGRVIDLLQKGDFDGVGTLCLYMLIVIFVSTNSNNLLFGCVYLVCFDYYVNRSLEFAWACAPPFSIS